MEKNIRTKIANFKDLISWQEGHQLVMLIYQVTKKFPKDEMYSLVDQIRRASISVTSNIAEGFGRQSYKEKAQFYYLAQGSLTELENQLIISLDVGYINKPEFEKINNQVIFVQKLLAGLIKKTKSYITK